MKDRGREYLVQKMEKSRCPDCGTPVDLLIRRDGGGPIFYICFADRMVAQAGAGRVPREKG